MAVEYDISSDVAVIKETGSVSQCARVTQMYSGQITYDDEAGSKFATATINGKSQRVMLCIAVSGTVTYDDVPSLYSTVDGHRCLNIVTPTETGTPDDVPSLYETVVIDGQNVRAVRCIMINKTPVYDGVSSTCTFTGDDGKTHTAQLVNKITGGSVEVIIKGTSPLNLPDAIANSLQYVKAFGGTEQNGTPTPDAPVDIVSNNGAIKYSKNLLDMSTENIVLGKYINNSGAVLDSGPNFYNSKYIPVVGGETYTWSTSSSIGYFSVMEYDSGYVFKRRTLFGSSSSSPAGTSGTVTLRSDAAFVLIGSNMDSTDVTLDKIAAIDWQFEKGSSATAYKPYSPTGIYADGTVETIAIKNNIFTLVGATYDETIGANGNPSASASNGYSDYLAVTGGDIYNFSNRGLSGVALYDQNKVFQSRPSVSVGDYTIPVGIAYIRVNFRQSYMDNISITHTNYTATAEMLLKLGDYQDEQEILSGAVTRNVGVKVLTGAADEQWGTSVSTKFYWDTDFAKALNYSPTLCTHYQAVLTDRTSGVGNNQIALFVNFAKGRIVICDPRFTTVSDFKAFLADQYAAGTPVTIIYPLAQAVTEQVAPQVLNVQTGNNILEITQASLSNLELEAKYQKSA